MQQLFRAPFSDREVKFLQDNSWDFGAKECARLLGRPATTIYAVMYRLGLKHNSKFSFNHFDVSRFTNPKDPFVIYFLGYFWADGTVSNNRKRLTFKIKLPDFNDLQPYLYRLGEGWNYGEYRNTARPHWTPLAIYSMTHRDLGAFLVINDYYVKSGASPDKILSYIPANLHHYWWRGYFDGDGSLSKLRTGVLSFNSGIDQDWSFVRRLEERLRIEFCIERRDRGTRAGSKALISNYPYISRLIRYMYNGEVFGLTRKRLHCEAYLNADRVKKPNLTSQYRGVCWDKRRRCYIMQFVHNENRQTKRFDSEIDAAQTYDKLALEAHGNKAKLNFPTI